MAEIDPEHRTLIRKKARAAADYGSNRPELWREWRATVDELGVPLADAIAVLNREQQRWCARFLFAEQRPDEGIIAYEKLLESSRDAKWIFSPEAEQYITTLEERRGPAAVVEAWERFARLDPEAFESIRRLIAIAEAKVHGPGAALQQLREITRRDHTNGQNHATLAAQALAAGLDEEAKRHLVAAAKRGVVQSPPGIDRLQLTANDLKRIAAEHATPEPDELLAAFVKHSGLAMQPAPPGVYSPHVYGGGDLDPPACGGCGKKLLLLATIDTTAAAQQEPTLAPLVATMPRLPLLHCDNCQWMFACPDYRIADDGRRIEIFTNVSLGPRNATFDTTTELKRQPAVLVPPTPPQTDDLDDAADEIDRQRWSTPQIGGAPRPINQPRRRFCPQCDAEQIFYAAVCDTTAFETGVVVNPDGYMYYFACPACRIISTDLDNT